MDFTRLPKSSWLDLIDYRDRLLAQDRYADPRCLSRHGRKVYSQADEDGLIAEIFNRIGADHRTFVEIGVESGIECNTLWLLMQGWTGGWIEGNAAAVEHMQHSHGHWLRSRSLRILQRFISAENIDDSIAELDLGSDIDLLSLDIDLNDYWVWKALSTVRPRVFCVEYNALWPPPAKIAVQYYEGSTWSRTNHFGASLAAFADLAVEKGYRLVGCSLSGANAFFVRADLCGDLFLRPGCVQTHYEPARYFLTDLPWGHPPGVAETVLL